MMTFYKTCIQKKKRELEQKLEQSKKDQQAKVSVCRIILHTASITDNRQEVVFSILFCMTAWMDEARHNRPHFSLICLFSGIPSCSWTLRLTLFHQAFVRRHGLGISASTLFCPLSPLPSPFSEISYATGCHAYVGVFVGVWPYYVEQKYIRMVGKSQ